MKQSIIIFQVFLIFISCSKDGDPNFNSNYDDIVKFSIHHSGLKISKYSKYINDILIETTDFYDSDTIIEKITRNSNNQTTYKKTFKLGSNLLAESCIDSSFNDNSLYVSNLAYEYENGYLIKVSINWKNIGSVVDSGVVYIDKVIENENAISSTESSDDWVMECTDQIDFNDISNIIDVENFSNEITGKINRNLPQHTLWNYGCPCGPSSSVAYSDYSYETENNGQITKKIETYTPCYHISTATTVTRQIKTTLYEYISN